MMSMLFPFAQCFTSSILEYSMVKISNKGCLQKKIAQKETLVHSHFPPPLPSLNELKKGDFFTPLPPVWTNVSFSAIFEGIPKQYFFLVYFTIFRCIVRYSLCCQKAVLFITMEGVNYSKKFQSQDHQSVLLCWVYQFCFKSHFTYSRN